MHTLHLFNARLQQTVLAFGPNRCSAYLSLVFDVQHQASCSFEIFTNGGPVNFRMIFSRPNIEGHDNKKGKWIDKKGELAFPQWSTLPDWPHQLVEKQTQETMSFTRPSSNEWGAVKMTWYHHSCSRSILHKSDDKLFHPRRTTQSSKVYTSNYYWAVTYLNE